MASAFNRTLVVDTDVASFYIFHPEDLAHRKTSPTGWPGYHFACQPEFEAGRLIAFDTGSDGTYKIRLTNESLTAREQEWLAHSGNFRLSVTRGRVYFDNGNSLPSDRYRDETEDYPDQWLQLENGNYKVTVNAIEWDSEPGAVDEEGEVAADSLPCYVVQFAKVDDLLGSTDNQTGPASSAASQTNPAKLAAFFS
ncbi:MAG TPA: DUF6386 family protein, partial [Pirellulales bacterium]